MYISEKTQNMSLKKLKNINGALFINIPIKKSINIILKTICDKKIFIIYISCCYLYIFTIDYKLNNLPQAK